jgi:serine/threonine-protein kinase RsbW
MRVLLRLRLAIDSSFKEVAFVASAIHAVALQGGLDAEAAQDLELAAVEALNNVVEHAHRDRHDLPIDVSVEQAGGQITVEIVDHGYPADAARFAAEEPPEFEVDPADLASLAESGRGIALMRQLVDEICYVPGSDGNRLRLTKAARLAA